jgi:hypothetical protein
MTPQNLQIDGFGAFQKTVFFLSMVFTIEELKPMTTFTLTNEKFLLPVILENSVLK